MRSRDQDTYQRAICAVMRSQVASDLLCCAAYMYSSAGYKMSRQPTLGKFGVTNCINHRGAQRDIKLPDFAAKMQKCKTELLYALFYPYLYSVRLKNIWYLMKQVLKKEKRM